jgi:hypothetical protein
MSKYTCRITGTEHKNTVICKIFKDGIEIPLEKFFTDTSKEALKLKETIIKEATRWADYEDYEDRFKLRETFTQILTNEVKK